MRFFALVNRQNKYSFSPLLAITQGIIQVYDESISLDKGDVVLLSFQSTEIDKVQEFIKELPSFIIKVAGGPHVTALPEHGLYMGFDMVFRGEGEEWIVPFLKFLEGGSDPPACLWTKDFKGTICRGVDINKFPPFSEDLPIPIEITRGCPFLCTYCQTPRIFGRIMRHRSPDNIITWVGKLVKRGIRDIRFITPNGLAYGGRGGPNPEMVLNLFKRLRATFPKARFYFGSFPSEFRPEHISFELLKELRAILSNKRIIFGAQSGSDLTLKELKRGHTVEHVFKATEYSLKAGFLPEVDFIFGLPFDYEKETLKVMRELVKMGARIHAHYFLPLPGTPLSLQKPRKLRPQFLKEIERITGEGYLFGQWKKQRRISETLYKINLEFSGPNISKQNKTYEEKYDTGTPSSE